jgi:hypothetical protein
MRRKRKEEKKGEDGEACVSFYVLRGGEGRE